MDMRTVIEESLRPLQRQLEEKDQVFQLEVDDNLPLVMGDQNRLIQVLTNLVSNAHKYTPAEGQIRLVAEVAPDQWSPKANAGVPVLHVYVQDTGIGTE